MDDDRRLIEGFLAGDAAAASTIDGWIRSAAFPYRYMVREEWDDGVQEAMVKVLEGLRAERFDGRSTLKTYVWRLTSYRFIDRLRRRKRRPETELEDFDLVDRDPDPAGLALKRERWRIAARVLERSSEACRQLWQLLLDGLDYRQIGEQLGVATGTLRVRLMRCRDRALELRKSSERS